MNMRIRRILTATVGVAQSVTALSTLIFACVLYFDLFNVQASLNISAQHLYFYVLTLLIFGFLSLTSGLFLVYEWLESR